MQKPQFESTGPKYSASIQEKAQNLTKECVFEFSQRVWEGINEKEGHHLLETICRDKGAERFWHPHKFRIAENTTKSFREISDTNTLLKAQDLYFVDIGPVFEGHEGDYGETFLFNGNNPEKEKTLQLAKEIFLSCEKKWLKENLKGNELYEFAQDLAKQNNHTLNLNMSGHRIGDFPHALYFKGKLLDIDFPISQGLWVLEILIKHNEKNWGGFYEDIIGAFQVS